MRNLPILGLLLFTWLSCSGDTKCVSYHVEPVNQVLNFINRDGCNSFKMKGEIPSWVIDKYRYLNDGSDFLIGDSTDILNINLSDMRIQNEFEYHRLLHLVVFSENTCLITYSEGGFVSRQVLDFYHLSDDFYHYKFFTGKKLRDKSEIIEFLKSNPEVELIQISQ